MRLWAKVAHGQIGPRPRPMRIGLGPKTIDRAKEKGQTERKVLNSLKRSNIAYMSSPKYLVGEVPDDGNYARQSILG